MSHYRICMIAVQGRLNSKQLTCVTCPQNQLNYMICIRKESGFCSVTYGVDRFDQFSPPERFEIFNVMVRIVNGKFWPVV